MDKFDFINTFLSQLISNQGLRHIYIFIIAIFGIAIIYNILMVFIKR